MNTRAIAAEYRLSHWAQIMQERINSGFNVKTFCKNEGISEYKFYYWQRRLREAACDKLAKVQSKQKTQTPQKFTEVKLLKPAELPTCNSDKTQIIIEIAGIRLTAGNEYPIENVIMLLRELVRPC